MKPIRDPAYLKFIRSLPCAVCPRDKGIEAAHVGRRGLSQKSSDRETIPLCSLHHQEQHRIGLRQFQASYELDIPALVEALNERPRIFPDRHATNPFYFAVYRDERFLLFPVSQGIGESVELAKMLCREYLIDSLFLSRFSRNSNKGSGGVRARK
jgi:hypothetical protein